MTPSLRRLAIVLALAACGLVSAPVGSEPRDDDAERARRAVREGRFVPLSTILDWIEPTLRWLGYDV